MAAVLLAKAAQAAATAATAMAAVPPGRAAAAHVDRATWMTLPRQTPCGPTKARGVCAFAQHQNARATYEGSKRQRSTANDDPVHQAGSPATDAASVPDGLLVRLS